MINNIAVNENRVNVAPQLWKTVHTMGVRTPFVVSTALRRKQDTNAGTPT